jgi:hypothetical protein
MSSGQFGTFRRNPSGGGAFRSNNNGHDNNSGYGNRDEGGGDHRRNPRGDGGRQQFDSRNDGSRGGSGGGYGGGGGAFNRSGGDNNSYGNNDKFPSGRESNHGGDDRGSGGGNRRAWSGDNNAGDYSGGRQMRGGFGSGSTSRGGYRHASGNEQGRRQPDTEEPDEWTEAALKIATEKPKEKLNNETGIKNNADEEPPSPSDHQHTINQTFVNGSVEKKPAISTTAEVKTIEKDESDEHASKSSVNDTDVKSNAEKKISPPSQHIIQESSDDGSVEKNPSADTIAEVKTIEKDESDEHIIMSSVNDTDVKNHTEEKATPRDQHTIQQSFVNGSVEKKPSAATIAEVKTTEKNESDEHANKFFDNDYELELKSQEKQEKADENMEAILDKKQKKRLLSVLGKLKMAISEAIEDLENE